MLGEKKKEVNYMSAIQMLLFLFYFFCFILDEAGFNYLIERKRCIHGADTHNKKVNLLVILIYCITAINAPISHTSPSNHTDAWREIHRVEAKGKDAASRCVSCQRKHQPPPD